MEKNLSVTQRVVYILFGFCGIVAIIKTGIWYGSVMATVIHTIAIFAAVDWGVMGVTGRDVVEWIEVAIEKA